METWSLLADACCSMTSAQVFAPYGAPDTMRTTDPAVRNGGPFSFIPDGTSTEIQQQPS